jgi:hypothetical protein
VIQLSLPSGSILVQRIELIAYSLSAFEQRHIGLLAEPSSSGSFEMDSSRGLLSRSGEQAPEAGTMWSTAALQL